MRCLITGGAGFIGSYLTEYLIHAGNEVVVLDDLSTGRLDNLSSVIDNPLFTFQLGSASDPSAVKESSQGCEEVYHLASCVGVKMIVEQPLRTMSSNIDTTRVVTEQAQAIGAKLFYCSSSEVYGTCLNGKLLHEDDAECYRWSKSLRWSYAATKAFGEYLAMAYAEERNLHVVIGRLFNIAGARQSAQYGMVIPRFVEHAIHGQPITVYGNGEQIRCFTDVTDAVRAIVLLMRTDGTHGQIFNIASGNVISIRELAMEVKRELNSGSSIVNLDPTVIYGEGFQDALYRLPDTRKLQTATGFHPTADIRHIIRSVANELESRNEIELRTNRTALTL